MSDVEAAVVFGGAFALFVLPGAISQTVRQERLAKRRGRLYAMTPGAVLPSRKSLLVGLGIAAVWAVAGITVALLN